MKYNKGDYIGGYKVLLPLKENGGVATYRVRGGDGLLYALKTGVSDAEKSLCEALPLYSDKGDGYVVYRYVSGETLEARISREGSISPMLARTLLSEILEQLIALNNRGFSHCRLVADNVMLDLADSEPKAWLTGFGGASGMTDETVRSDIEAVGRLIYRMIYGEEPESPLRVKCLEVRLEDADKSLEKIMYKAIAADFKSATEIAECLKGKEADEIDIKKPIGPGFTAVAGLEEVKNTLRENVIEILADRKRAEEYGITIPNGMLLYGPPGCGKTFLAERFAEEAVYNYQYVKSSDLASTYLHGSQEKIASLFNLARKNAPTILCFDEFDALVPRRDDINNASQSAEVNEFLSQLNNCGKDGVFVIATTNRPDKIDPAVLRSGRIDYKVYIPIPDVDAREAIFRLELEKRPTEDRIDYGKLSSKTKGYIASDIAAVVLDAARDAFHKKAKIDMKMLLSAISQRNPSLSKADAAMYEKIRKRMEDIEDNRRRVGF